MFMQNISKKNPSIISKKPDGFIFFNEIKKIPKGQTISYKQLAEKIGRPMAYRAVANACGKNPDPKTIPCHRVV